MPTPADMEALVRAKKLDDVEARFLQKAEADPTDLAWFLPVAQSIRRADEKEKKRGATLLALLADRLADRKEWLLRIDVLGELGRTASSAMPLTDLRKKLRDSLLAAFSGAPSLAVLIEKFGLEHAATPAVAVEATEKIRRWAPYDVGGVFYMPDHGAGRVAELNLQLGNVKVDFERRKGVSVPVGAAPKYLIPLRPGHVLREHLEKPGPIAEMAEKEPAELFRRLVAGFGRPLTMQEVRAAAASVVPEARWARFWTAVQKHPQIVVVGKGKNATFGWSESALAAADTVKAQFEAAPLSRKLELAKKHGKKGALAAWFAEQLAAEAEAQRDTDPSLALEILAAMEKLPTESPLSWSSADIVADHDPSRLLPRISDRALRERVLLLLRDTHSAEWPALYRDAFLREEDSRTLTKIADALATDSPADWRVLVDDILRQPRRHTMRFLWFCERSANVAASDPLPGRVDLPLLVQVMSAIDQDEFGPVRPRLRNLLDRGGLAIRIIHELPNEDHGRQVLSQLEKVISLEGFRKGVLEEAVFRRFPELRSATGPEALFATPEAAEAKRKEVEHLLKVELPANGKAMQEAVALGDLSENFEYKSARQKHEYLTARIAAIHEELSRVRILKPEEVDASEVRVGTRLRLRGGEGERIVTVLGPWESKPEESVYSYQSDLGKSLLGRRTGEEIKIGDSPYVIEKIDVWTEPVRSERS